jgi:hypothetical protein
MCKAKLARLNSGRRLDQKLRKVLIAGILNVEFETFIPLSFREYNVDE